MLRYDDYDIITALVTNVLESGSPSQAMHLMQLLREEAMRIDRHLGDPRHVWNSVYGK